MAKSNKKDITTKQVKKHIPNPTGKGGFGENPQNRSNGRWSKENSFSYWMNYFKHLSTADFLKWMSNNPEDKRTVASDLAYTRVMNARKDLQEFKEVADRTEGRSPQTVDITTKGKPLPTPILDALHNNDGNKEDK